MPMRRAVSKSRDTARIAMPVLVWLMKSTSAMTSRTVSSGVTTVMTFILSAPSMNVPLRKGISG